ncbi:uncharacterized protein At3g27210-like isoform X1 [Durio zibethinus]|uniref:Uncharacterized protein At3g27210-like isoform X1 n=1 Tax=Durio zibethinus TaxID=66656 RepID=A0A6P6BB13_DURZI|nr:uncharacterized protein At3g27210-like isoform X1 [Durio zibethinus]
MGSCVSVHESSQESAMKLGLSFGSKTDKLIFPPSPVKEKHVANGSKDETFFDSRPYLDSDCEDDFFSVNGDFTPSRGNTPVHHSFPVVTPRVNKATVEGSSGSVSEISPTGKRKKLVELFRERIREDQDVNELNTSSNQDIVNGKMEVKLAIQVQLPSTCADGNPYVSRASSLCSSERTANGDNPMLKEKPLRSVHCCLPSLVSCSSFSERKKKMSSAIAVNDKP